MTKYHGGKQRIGKEIAQIISENSPDDIVGYCEPFCGMLGVYQHIPKMFGEKKASNLKYKAGDINKSVIAMWKELQKGWIPDVIDIDREMFNGMRYDGEISALKGFVGHVSTYRGIFFDGYFPQKRSQIKHSKEKVVRIAKELKEVSFTTGKYDQFSDLHNYVIYCDPPYQGTEQRYFEGEGHWNRLKFDSDKFWEWCKEMSKTNTVFVSEYSQGMVSGIEKIWEKDKEKLYYIKC